MKRPTIGIPGWSLGENSFGCQKAYLEWVNRFGDVRIIMPHETDVISDLSLLVVPGGMDVAPSNYNAIPGFYTSNTDVFKEHFFKNMLPKYVKANVPIFGICLGLQQIAVYFGIPLEQNLMFHAQSKHDGDSEAHDVMPYYGKRNKDTIFKTNSFHHQCVLLSEMLKNEDLYVDLIAEHEEVGSEDAIVEAFHHKHLPIYCVQFHPERQYDNYSTRIMNNLLKITKKEATTCVV